MIDLENINDSLNKINLEEKYLFEDIEDKIGTNKNTSIFEQAKICFKSKLFCFSTISLIILLLILSGIQF